MNTLDDLTHELRRLESEAPSVDDVRRRLDEHRAPSRTKRIGLPLAVAASVVAIAAGTVWATADHGPADRSTPPVTSPLPEGTPTPVDLSWRFRVAPVPGYHIGRTSIDADVQGAILMSSDGATMGSISLFRRGFLPASDIADLRKGSRVPIHGTTGWFGAVGGQATLGWEYAPGAWALVGGDWGKGSGTKVDLAAARGPALAIARAVDTTVSDKFTVAYRVGYLPRGLVAAGAQYDVDLDGRPDGEVDLVDNLAGERRNGRPAAPAVLVRRTHSDLSDLDPAVLDAKGPTTSLTVNGRPARYNESAGWLSIDYPGGTHLQIVVDAKHLARYPRAELLKIARSISPVGRADDAGTWIPATRALPQ